MTWFSDLARWFFFLLDKVIYTLIDKVYGLFLEIANTTIFTDEMIESFAGKIYYLVGIFMLFKVSFSILTYIINPDEFADKNKGMSKLVTNIITSLIMLLGVPFIFSQAMDIQRIALKDDIIPKFFSTEFENGKRINISSQDPEQGSQMAKMAFETFYSPEGTYTLTELFNTDVNLKDANGDYMTEYNFAVSTVVGGVLALLLISFCFDIALRSVKLGFLRLIAPVPIISRIDPKKGNEIFSKWTKTCVSTYLDIFMRLAAIFFALYIIKALQQSMFVDAVTGGESAPGALTKVFIMLGALMFAKQFPKLLEDILGIKLGGSFTLNPMRRMSEVPLAGKLAAAGIGAADSLFHGNGFKDGFKRNWNNVSWGGDGKSSILATADRKMRRDVHTKRDYAKDRYEGAERQKLLEEQLEEGKAYASQAKEKVYSPRFLASKNSVDDAKAAMYDFKNQVSQAEANYQAVVSKYGVNDEKSKKAYEALELANKNYGTAQGQYEYRKKLHDAVRQQCVKDAKIEDAIEAYEKTGGKKIDKLPDYMGKYSSTTSNSNPPSSSNDAYSYNDQYMGSYAPPINNNDSEPDIFNQFYDADLSHFNQFYDDNEN